MLAFSGLPEVMESAFPLGPHERLILLLLSSAEGKFVSKHEICIIAFGVFYGADHYMLLAAAIESLKVKIAQIPGFTLIEGDDRNAYRLQRRPYDT